MSGALGHTEGFNKEVALDKFLKENPQWNKARRYAKFEPTPEYLEKVIALYPDTPNTIIAEMLGVTYNQMALTVMFLRKKGVVLHKEIPTVETKLDDAFSKIKHDD